MPYVPVASTVFAIAVPLNFVWEMVQAPLYAPMGTFWEATWRCFGASLGDGLLILVVWLTGVIVFRSEVWFSRPSAGRLAFPAGVGLGLAILVETWGLEMGRWAYGPHMPILPGTSIGIVPLLQMTVLAPLTLRLAGKESNES